MITPRRTRLIRVADLHTYRRVIAALASGTSAPHDTAILVPTHAAATVLAETIGESASTLFSPAIVTRDGLYDDLHRRLLTAPRRLTVFERDAIAQAAAEEAAQRFDDLPFRIRPGLVAEVVRFYDQLKRQPQLVSRFESLITEALGGGDLDDRGAERLLRQTQFLSAAFHAYERRVVASDAVDEHALRSRLIAQPSAQPLLHLIVTVADWIAEPSGLHIADFELLAQIPGLATLDLVCTTAMLGSGFHERLDRWWPGLEEVEGERLIGVQAPRRPVLIRPPIDDDDHVWTTFRDREEELHAVAHRLQTAPDTWTRAAIVFKQPLPYLYLAPETLGAVNIRYRTFDALPLAAEPPVAVIDLVLDAVETSFSRDSLVALLSSPFVHMEAHVPRQAIAAMNRMLSSERYLGGLDRLATLSAAAAASDGIAALDAALTLASELAPLQQTAPASTHLRTLRTFLATHAAPVQRHGLDALSIREQDAWTRVTTLLADLEGAHRSHHDPDWGYDDLATAVRRWIGEHTCPSGHTDRNGIALLDDQAVRYMDLDDVTVVGLIENEWPERPRRNIFYPPGLLKALGWPSERDRRAADDARFLDVLASPAQRISLSTFTLDDEAIVSRSVQLDEVPGARLSTVVEMPPVALQAPLPPPVPESAWSALRVQRTAATDAAFHGFIGVQALRPWSVSALETYIGCPFKFYAQHVLKLDEEPDDEEVMDPRRQGQFVHQVFEDFFIAWQDAGHKAITPDGLGQARQLFTAVVDRALASLPEGEAALERTRLLGSSAASGLGEAVFRMEAERPVPVVERLLEHSLKGSFTIATAAGPRVVELRGKADRVDLLADGTFRLIDYKLGWPPDKGRALQLPIYSVCAEQRLAGHRGRTWTLGEAVYLAFKGPKRVVPLFTSADARIEVIAAAQQRLAETLDAITRGDFPPSPDDVFRCETCSFTTVCRKDYVGDV